MIFIRKNFFSEKGRLEGTMGKFCDFISEKGRLQGTSEIFEKIKVQREKWPVPSNGPPLYKKSGRSHIITKLVKKLELKLKNLYNITNLKHQILGQKEERSCGF